MLPWWPLLASHLTSQQPCLSCKKVAMLPVPGELLAPSCPDHCPIPVHTIPRKKARTSSGSLVKGCHRKMRLKIQNSHSLTWMLRSLGQFLNWHFFNFTIFMCLVQTIAKGEERWRWTYVGHELGLLSACPLCVWELVQIPVSPGGMEKWDSVLVLMICGCLIWVEQN